MGVEIRPGTPDDLEALTDIYNHYVRESQATFDTEPFTPEQRRAWLDHYSTTGRYRLFVADDGGVLLGYATTSPVRERQAYETSVEVTIYLAPDATGRRIGTQLYEALFAAIEGEDVHRAYAGIAMPNDASVALHEQFGFCQVGNFSEQGRKLGRYWDVAWFEKEI